MGKKVAIVSGHFMPEIGYQEVHLAKSFVKIGYETRVFSSTVLSPNGKSIINSNYKSGLSFDHRYGYSICRFNPVFSFGAVVIVKELVKAIDEFNPDYIIIIGIAKLFPLKILSKEIYHKYKIINIFGDSYQQINQFGLIRRNVYRVYHRILKYWLYNRVVDLSHRIILNLPETKKIFIDTISRNRLNEFENKSFLLHLGYDSDSFFFDHKLREKIRFKEKIKKNETVFITTTRVNPLKKIDVIINEIAILKKADLKVKYIIIGFQNDDYSNQLKSYISKKGLENNVICLPFLSHKKIRGYYCASDIGIWTQPAISIQEALGTGLPVICLKGKAISHVIKQNKNGWVKIKNITSRLQKSIKEINNKKSIFNKRHRLERSLKIFDTLSYDNVSKKILNDL